MKMPKALQLPSGSWRIQITVDGKRIGITEPTEEEAVTKALSIKAGMLEKQAKPKKLTLDEAVLEYESIRENVLSPATVRGYEIVRKNRFKDLMKQDIYKITKRDIQKAVDAEAAFVSPKTIANAYGLIRSVLKDYEIDISGVKLPQKIRKKKTYLSTADIAKFIDTSRGDDCEIPMVMAVWLGLRRSEIVGLCWDCVDFENSTIEIKRTMVPNKENKFVLKDGAKNEGSQRTIKCPAYIMNKLKEMYKGQNGRIFNVSPETVRRHTHAICEKAGIPDTTVHGLRHTNAAVMVALNITDKYAMARGGWTTENTFKQIYAYVFPEGASQADDLINQFFEDIIT
jgi:integrase